MDRGQLVRWSAGSLPAQASCLRSSGLAARGPHLQIFEAEGLIRRAGLVLDRAAGDLAPLWLTGSNRKWQQPPHSKAARPLSELLLSWD